MPVRVFGDRLLEDDETFEVHLTDAINAGYRDPLGLGTILDDEACLGPNLVVNGSGELALNGRRARRLDRGCRVGLDLRPLRALCRGR